MTTRQISGFSKYTIDEDGHISGPRAAQLKWRLDRYGYPQVCLRDDEDRKKFVYVHVLVITTFKGPRPPGHVVCHFDGNKLNANISNLRYGTITDNAADGVRLGKSNKGSKHGRHRLTEAEAAHIVSAIRAGTPRRVLAREYGVDPATIRRAFLRTPADRIDGGAK